MSKFPYRSPQGESLGAIGIGREISQRPPDTPEPRADDQQPSGGPQEQALAYERAARAEAEAAQQRLQFLAEAGSLLAASLDFEETLARVVRLAVPFLADLCVVDLVGSDYALERVAVAHRDPVQEDLLRAAREQYQMMPREPHPLQRILRTGRSMLIADVPDNYYEMLGQSNSHAQTLRDLGVTSAMGLPLRGHGRLLGMISFGAVAGSRRYGPADLALAEQLAQRIALALENARLYRDTQRHLAVLTTVQQVAQMINTSFQLDAVFQMVVTQLCAALSLPASRVYLREGGRLVLRASAGAGHGVTTIDLETATPGQVVRSGQAVFVRDLQDSDARLMMPGARQAIIVPLNTGDQEVLGVLLVESTAMPPLTDDDFGLLKVLGDQISIAVTNAQRFAETRSVKEFLKALLDNTPAVIYATTADTRLRMVNPAFEQLTERAEAEVVGRPLAEVFPGEVGAQLIESHQQVIRSGRALDVEEYVDTPAGRRFYRSSKFPLSDADGRIDAVGGISVDITDRRRAEEALRVSEARFRLTVTHMPYAVVIYDADLRLLFVNPHGIAQSGYAEQDLLGRTDAELYPPEVCEQYLPLLRAAAATRTIQSGECTIPRPAGLLTILISYVPLLDDEGQIRQILGISYDITQRKRDEETRLALERQLLEAQQLESLGVLAGGIAHDFNNLLAVILGNAGLALLDLPPEASARELLEQIEVAAKRAADLTQQMLAYAGKGHFVLRPLDLNELLEAMTPLLRSTVQAPATLDYQLAEALPPILGDGSQLRQVVMNLILNAVEALDGKPGRIAISTAVRRVDQRYLASCAFVANMLAGEYVVLEVVDSGAGIEPSILPRIFEPFFTTKFAGRGLGLAAVLGIVRRHGGALRVANRPGEGARFTILLPRAAPPEKETIPAPALTAAPANGRVLVIDDETGVRTLVARVLERMDFEAIEAVDGRAGIELFRANADSVVAVLLDLTMPEFDGEQVFAALRAIKPGTPVIVMSGHASQEVLARFAGPGVAGVLHKPFTAQELRTLLQQLPAGDA